MANSCNMKDLLTTALEDSGLLFEDMPDVDIIQNQSDIVLDNGLKPPFTTDNQPTREKQLVTRLYSPSIEGDYKDKSLKSLSLPQTLRFSGSTTIDNKNMNDVPISTPPNMNPKITLMRLPITSALIGNNTVSNDILKFSNKISVNSVSQDLAQGSKTIIPLTSNKNIQLNQMLSNISNSNISEIPNFKQLTPQNQFNIIPSKPQSYSISHLNMVSKSLLQNIQSSGSPYSNILTHNKNIINKSNFNQSDPNNILPATSSDQSLTDPGSLAERFEQFVQKKAYLSSLGGHVGAAHPQSAFHPLMGPGVTAVNQQSLLLHHASGSMVDKEATEEEMAELEDQLRHVETYAEYMPKKLRYGCRHPDPVVETNSLSSVEPPGIWYNISLPESIIDTCALSALQLEAIIYACQQHETLLPDGSRAGFLIGDGPGVGKGRTIAGIIYENYILRRKRAIWLSVSNDLKYDAERDLKDIDAGKISVASLNKFKYKKISSKANGSFKKGIIFATYSSLIGESQRRGKYNTRMRQLLKWCGKDFDGVIIFDECHKAKNLVPSGSSKPTKTGLAVLELQNRLPKARVVYASATGATEPKNMAYMVRLGIWGRGTPFKEFSDFIQAVERRGVGAMELVAMDMKLRGTYMARQLSFAGVSFNVKEAKLNQNIREIYDASVTLWGKAREKFQLASDLVDNAETLSRKQLWSQFWAAHQRFFKYLCLAAKVSMCIDLAKQAIKEGKCVVIGLQTTGEARTLEHIEECGGELFDFISTAKGVLQSLVEKHFPTSGTPEGNAVTNSTKHLTTPSTIDNYLRLKGLTGVVGGLNPAMERLKDRRRLYHSDRPKASRWLLDSAVEKAALSSAKLSQTPSGGSETSSSLQQKIDDVFSSSLSAATVPPQTGTSNKSSVPSRTNTTDDLDRSADSSSSSSSLEDRDGGAASSGGDEDDEHNPFGPNGTFYGMTGEGSDVNTCSDDQDGDNGSSRVDSDATEQNGGDSDEDEAPWLVRKKVTKRRRRQQTEAGKFQKKKKFDADDTGKPPPFDVADDDDHGTKEELGVDTKSAVGDRTLSPPPREDRVSELIKKEEEEKVIEVGGDVPSSVLTGVDTNRPDNDHLMEFRYNGYVLPTATCISNTKDNVKLMKHELLAEIEELGDRLPPNTLDQLIEELGGTERVAEMTGRKGRVVTQQDGTVVYQSRGECDVPLEALNVKEKQRFMDGLKKIAIISEAASSGISLQSDRRALNQLRRVHVTLELPWSADKAVQQFGRTHRSNQVSAPEYIFLISELAGERRFASIVAKRLESLGALTHGDRRATETRDLSQFNFDNKYGRMALDSVMRSILTPSAAFVDTPTEYGPDFLNDARDGLIAVGLIVKEHHGYTLDKDYSNIVKFLNRLLGLKVKLQNALFQYFTDTLNAYILDAKRTGKWDMGILDFGNSGDSVTPLRKQIFHFHTSRGVVSTQLWCFQVQRGLPWENATKLYREQQDLDDGFFVSKQVKNGNLVPILALSHASRKNTTSAATGQAEHLSGDKKLFNIYRPNTGLQGKMETLGNLLKKYRKVPPQEAETHWEAIFTSSQNQCSHVLWKGSCKKANSGQICDIGIRTRKYYVLAGSVLSVWNCLEELFSYLPGVGPKMQIIRVRTKNDLRIIGVWVRVNHVQPLVKILSRESNKQDSEDFIEEIL